MWRNVLMIGREVFRLHPEEWTDSQWDQARDFIALALVEQDEQAN